MNKSTIIATMAIFGLFSLGANAQQTLSEKSHKIITQKYDVGSFNEVEVANAVEVEFTVGAKPYMELQTEEWVQPFVMLDNHQGTLSIHLRSDWTKNTADKNQNQPKVLVRLQAPALNEVTLMGASTFRVLGTLAQASSSLELSLAGASAFNCGDVDMEDFSVEMLGASSLRIKKFKGKELEIKAMGASSVNIASVAVEEAEIQTAGASSVTIKGGTVKKLEVTAMGASTVMMKEVKSETGYRQQLGTSKIEAPIELLKFRSTR